MKTKLSKEEIEAIKAKRLKVVKDKKLIKK